MCGRCLPACLAATTKCFELCSSCFLHQLTRCCCAWLQMNRESSRSHLIMTICIEATNLQTQSVSRGKLSFVDLAGSERWVGGRLAAWKPGAAPPHASPRATWSGSQH